LIALDAVKKQTLLIDFIIRNRYP